MQWLEKRPWIPSLGMQYLLGVDGISLPFLPLTALVNFCVILSSWNSIRHLPRLYYAMLMALEGATMGVFSALDLGLFFLFWELTLPALYFLISLWGMGPQRRHAATQYAVFMLAGGVPLLLGFITLALNHASEIGVPAPEGLEFNYLALLETPIALETQELVFFLLLLGFVVKAPTFPFHVWLPNVAMEGPVGISAVLTGLKLGLYGIIRFTVPLTPQASQLHANWLIGLGMLGAIYGALIALKQTNLRRLLAYSSISHVGVVLLGIASFQPQGIAGAVLQTWNFALVSTALFLLAGFVHRRLGSTDLTVLQGMAVNLPQLSAFFFIFGFATLAIPGTSAFVAELLVILGAFKAKIGLGVGVLLSAVLSAAYILRFYQNALLGKNVKNRTSGDSKLRPQESLTLVILLILVIGLGIFPGPVVELAESNSQLWIKRLEIRQIQMLALHSIQHP